MPGAMTGQTYPVIVNISPVIEELGYELKIQGTSHRSAPGQNFFPLNAILPTEDR